MKCCFVGHRNAIDIGKERLFYNEIYAKSKEKDLTKQKKESILKTSY